VLADKSLSFGIGAWLLFGHWDLGIGHSLDLISIEQNADGGV
jgi:hypothetical protein